MDLKLINIGSSVGVILPKRIAERLHVKKGDRLYLSETKNGIELSPYDPNVEKQMEIAKDIMVKNRNVLRQLAK